MRSLFHLANYAPERKNSLGRLCSYPHETARSHHYISFIAAQSSDRLQIVKLYPEGNAETRFKISGVKRILFYCNRDGLFCVDPVKGIDDKESGYDDVRDRRELERTAKILFG